MNFEFRGMYKYLTSHTFPGLLLGVEILYIVKIIKPALWFYFLQICCSNTSTVIVLSILAYAFSTLLGVVVDSVHHFLYENVDYNHFKIKRNDELTVEFFESNSGSVN